MNLRSTFIEILQSAIELPESFREHATDFTSLEEHRIDQSYIDFLDTQISLSPRGPEWTALLNRRRAALLPFCGITLLRGCLITDKKYVSVEIDPKARTVIHWETHSLTST